MTVAALIVNPSESFHHEFTTHYTAQFGNGCTYTRYERPFADGHPRLRPDPNPYFELIVIDLELWAEGKPAEDLVTGELPSWIETIVATASQQACIVILCPDPAVYAVRALVAGIHRSPCPIVCAKGLSKVTRLSLTQVIHEEWKIWQYGPPAPDEPPPDPGVGWIWKRESWRR